MNRYFNFIAKKSMQDHRDTKWDVDASPKGLAHFSK